MNRKENQVERYLKQLKKTRPRDEQKALEREARERKAQRSGPRPRGRDWIEEGEEAPERERIRRPKKHPASRSRKAAPEVVAGVAEGTVLSVLRGAVVVRVEGTELQLPLGPEFHGEEAPVAHDRVEVVDRGGRREVRAILPRRSFLARPDPGRPDRDRVFAANVDVAVLVVSLHRPEFRARLVDRALVLVRRGGVEPLVVVSKMDLAGDGAEREGLERHLEPYRALGLVVRTVSVETGEGLQELRADLLGRAVVLFGQSGVGKSSLLNGLALTEEAPRAPAEVGRVRTGDGKGRHTTTVSRVHELAGGTRVIDTPGVRALGLAPVDRVHLREAFPEFDPAGRCRFSDCLHGVEPGCGVREAVERGELPGHRFDAYLRLAGSLEHDR